MKIQNRTLIALLIILAIVGIGLAIWQNYKLQQTHKKEIIHVASVVHRATYFLETTRNVIEAINKEQKWDEASTRNSFLIWLSYAKESLTEANSTINDFPSLLSYQDRENMNNIDFWYSLWFERTNKALSKSGVLTIEDQADITELSHILSQVNGLSDSIEPDDWHGISVSLSELHDVWENSFEKDN